MKTNGTLQAVTELEAELNWLSALVRERRKQLARLEKCPNKDCPCRFIWREHIEKKLVGQISKIRQKVQMRTILSAKPKARTARRSRK